MKDIKSIALTFDDGPNLTVTPLVLDLLDKYSAKGSFFLVGNNINPDNAQVLKRMVSGGHEINSHSLTHSDMTGFSADEIKNEMDETSHRIEMAAGVTPKFFRPPYIAYNELMFDTIDLPFICGHGCDDWDKNVSTQSRIDTTLANSYDGAVILLHDQFDNYQTVKALETLIPTLIERGFALVTVSELFRSHGISPHSDIPIIYSDVFKTQLY